MLKLKQLLQAAAAIMVVASLGSVEGTAQAAPTPDAPTVVDTSREPMGDLLRGSIIRNGDADAMAEVVETCQTYGSDFRSDTSASAVDRLHDEMYKVEQRHWRRVQMKRDGGMFYFRSFPDGYVPPKDPISLTCQAITGIPVPARSANISRAFYAERVQKWRTAAYAERHPKEEAPVVVSVTPPKEDKPADTKATGEVPVPKATVSGPKAGDMAGMPVVDTKIGKCEPSTFAVKSKTDDELVLKVRPGANYWQLKDSCWAEKYETKASEVILANKAEVTIPYCTAKPNTLPALKDFDPMRWNLGKKGALKLGDAANKAFVESCSEEGRLGYALQAGQELHLSKKVDAAAKAAEEAQKAAEAAEAKKAEEAKAAEEAKKVAEKKAADEAEAAKKAEEAKAVSGGADAGKPADANPKPADSAKVDGAGGAAPADSSFRVDQAGSAQGPPAPNPTANGPPNTL